MDSDTRICPHCGGTMHERLGDFECANPQCGKVIATHEFDNDPWKNAEWEAKEDDKPTFIEMVDPPEGLDLHR